MTTVYIAGPMTGLPGYNLDAFTAAETELAAFGHDPVNPGRHGVVEGFTWTDYLRRGVTELCACDAVAVLPGWENSRGARLEVHVARALGMPVEPLAGWLA